jgi:hypothetical protein
MLGILDLVILVWSHRRRCTHCGSPFWAPPIHRGKEVSIGRERYVCVCGNKYETGRHEWVHLTPEEKRKYLWSGLVVIPAVTTILAAIIGYFLKWHEPYWTMAVILGFLGLLGGLICSALLWVMRSLPVMLSLRRTRHGEPAFGATTWQN